jgi:phospholipid/cholesterol/gamma-HCH transport system substrate-binding protein
VRRLSKRILMQLAIFAVVSLTAIAVMVFGYVKLPTMLFGVGRYTVTVELPTSGGLYPSGNVTFHGTEVGRVESVHLTKGGDVVAELSLKSGLRIPSDVVAEIHSQSAIGEQFVALVPRDDASRPLRNGDVIPPDRTTVPPDINSLLDAANRGLQAIPHDSLKTVIDESSTALDGLGPDLARLVDGSTTLVADARSHLDDVTNVVDHSGPLLDAQAESADSIEAWAAHLAAATTQLQDHDAALAGLIDQGASAAAQGTQLVERLKPTLPIILANLVSIGDVAVVYQPDIEQLLALVPQSLAEFQAIGVPGLNTKQGYRGGFLAGNLNVNLPPPCTTGFLPIQQQRAPTFEDYPDRPAGDLYCRVPQDSSLAVRGARNLPCETRPGKRAPTVKMCESDEEYVPLNDGDNWKGDPNATVTGQDIPQQPPGAAPAAASPPPIAAAPYDPATGTYVGPDGKTYAQSNLAHDAHQGQTWQSMMMPPSQP